MNVEYKAPAHVLETSSVSLDIAGPDRRWKVASCIATTGNTNNNKNVREISGRLSAPFFSSAEF